MKIYMAGMYPTGLASFLQNEAFIQRRAWKRHYVRMPHLESYHYIQSGRIFSAVEQHDDKIFLDSGAFSMFTQKVDVDLAAYANFIKEHKKNLVVASNLDVIGKGNEKATWKNQRALEKMGVEICPVHHARDKDEWLHFYIEKGYKYIFLGGMVPESTTYLKNWLDRIWGSILTDSTGKPKVKVHGFGLTTDSLMKRYPWHSVDSTSWAMVGSNGCILYNDGNTITSKQVSDISPAKKKKKVHYDTMTEESQVILKKYVKKRGYSLKDIQGNYAYRWLFNVQVYRDLQDNYPWPKTFNLKQVQLSECL